MAGRVQLLLPAQLGVGVQPFPGTNSRLPGLSHWQPATASSIVARNNRRQNFDMVEP